jgi:hypothetical protein
MSPEQIERLQREYTDQYVQVTGGRAEHQRFASAIGQVKTINMNGRALVEFAEHHRDIGWYDIDLDFLKVVDKPAASEPAKQPVAAKQPPKGATAPSQSPPAAGKKMSPLEMARAMGAKKGGDTTAPSTVNKLTPLEMARQMGAAKSTATATPAAAAPAKPTKKAVAGLSPIEQLKQMGAKRGDAAAAAVTQPSSASDAAPSSAGQSRLSPLEILRAQGAKRGGDAQAVLAGEAASDADQQPVATPTPVASGPAPLAECTPLDPVETIPPECTPEPLRRARELEAKRASKPAAGFPTTADIFAISQGKKPRADTGDSQRNSGAAVQGGGKLTSRPAAGKPLTASDIWAIAKGERTVATIVATESKNDSTAESTAAEASAAAAVPPATSGKPSTAEIIAKLRGQS